MKPTKILSIVGLTILFMLGSHLFDIASVIKANEGVTATNGFYSITVVQLSHIGWYMMYAAFFILLVTHILLYAKDHKEMM